jgi:hypothetical protein
MANSNNKQSGGLISKAIGVAKKLSSTGAELAEYVAPGSIVKLSQRPDPQNIIDVTRDERAMTEQKKYENPQQLFREQVPQVTQKIFGRHYSKINNITSFVSPDLNNKVADYFFDKLNDFVSELSSVEHVLSEVGAKKIEELKSSPDRANRIGEALANQNKLIAAVQGAISGATGVVGTAIDIPFSLGLTLRSIYQEGRAHGFELNHRQEQEIVEYVFKQVDLGAIAEKQTLLIALRTITNLIETQDTQQLQTLLGSSNDFSVLKTWLSNQDGTFKWNWLNKIPQISILSKLSPIAGAGIGAVYSWKLVDEAHTKARAVFSGAQQYLLQHPEDQLDVRQAYERGAALLDQATLPDPSDISLDVNAFAEKLEQQEVIEVEDAAVHNDTIKAIKIETKSNEDETQSVSVEEGLKALAEKHVEPASEPELQADEEKSLGEAEVLEKPVRKRRSTKKKADVDDALIATDKKQ